MLIPRLPDYLENCQYDFFSFEVCLRGGYIQPISKVSSMVYFIRLFPACLKVKITCILISYTTFFIKHEISHVYNQLVGNSILILKRIGRYSTNTFESIQVYSDYSMKFQSILVIFDWKTNSSRWLAESWTG